MVCFDGKNFKTEILIILINGISIRTKSTLTFSEVWFGNLRCSVLGWTRSPSLAGCWEDSGLVSNHLPAMGSSRMRWTTPCTLPCEPEVLASSSAIPKTSMNCLSYCNVTKYETSWSWETTVPHWWDFKLSCSHLTVALNSNVSSSS